MQSAIYLKPKTSATENMAPPGNLLAKHDKQGTTRYQYDAEGNLIAKQEPNGKMWRYSWNGAGFLQQVIRPDDTCVSFYTTHWGAEFAKPIRAKLPIGFGMAIILCTNGESVLTDIKPKNTPHYAADISAATTPELTPMQAQGPLNQALLPGCLTRNRLHLWAKYRMNNFIP